MKRTWGTSFALHAFLFSDALQLTSTISLNCPSRKVTFFFNVPCTNICDLSLCVLSFHCYHCFSLGKPIFPENKCMGSSCTYTNLFHQLEDRVSLTWSLPLYSQYHAFSQGIPSLSCYISLLQDEYYYLVPD